MATSPRPSLADQWSSALAGVVVRHPNPESRPSFTISGDDEPILLVSISNHRDTRGKNDGMWSSFTISNVRLTFFPGVRLAHAWIAAAWAGYIQHEALELVEVDGRNPLDPHQEPHRLTPWNRGLRDGFPSVLTRDALISALSVVMDRDHAIRLVEAEHG